jgi:hypothetical protein
MCHKYTQKPPYYQGRRRSGLIPQSLQKEKAVTKLVIGSESKGFKSEKKSSRKAKGDNLTPARQLAQDFGPFKFAAQDMPEMFELKLEVDVSGKPLTESHMRLTQVAQALLSYNVTSKDGATGKDDIGWVSASWAHPEAEGILNPWDVFEVGVVVPRKPRSRRECERNAEFLTLGDDLPQGLTMIPGSKDGRHVNVTMLGVLLKPGMVEVTRGGARLGSSTIWDGLRMFGERQRERWSQLTPEEAAEAQARTEAEAQAQAQAAEDKAGHSSLDEVFEAVIARAKEEERAKVAAQKHECWLHLVANSEQALFLWDAIASEHNEDWVYHEPLNSALMAMCRPAKAPSFEAVGLVFDYMVDSEDRPDSDLAQENFTHLREWLKSTYRERLSRTMEECLGMLEAEMPGILTSWFRPSENGKGFYLTRKLPKKLGVFASHEAFVARVEAANLTEENRQAALGIFKNQ